MIQVVQVQRISSRAALKRIPTAKMSASGKPSSQAAIDLLMLMQKLKTTKRTGWIRRNVQGPESIADHMYRMGVMSMIACPDNVDRTRCIKMSIVHDMAEAIVGDIPPNAGVCKEEKARLEQDAIKQIKEMVGENTLAGEEIEELFMEYEMGETPEACLVKDFDKLEMILQAHEYEQAQGMPLQEFFDSTEGKFKTDVGRALAAEVVRRRDAKRATE